MGKLVDIYLGGRRDASGSFFAYVRFETSSEPASIELGLNEIIIRGKKLVANLAKHTRKAQGVAARVAPWIPQHAASGPRRGGETRDSRSFADVAKGKVEAAPIGRNAPLVISCIQEVKDWACNSTMVGEIKSFDILCNFPSLLALEGYDIIEVNYLWGMQVIVKFKSARAVSTFKTNKSI